jgi:uncharacterized protein YndB with AHSA1/START domain
MLADRIEREIAIDAPIEVVWSAVSDPDQMKLWFAELDIEVSPGAEGRITFDRSTSGGGQACFNIRIERVAPPFYLAFRWVYPDGAAADPSNAPLVEFTLFEEGEERTRVKLVESGLGQLEWDEAEKRRYFDSHAKGWEFHAGRLAGHMLEVTRS